VAVNNLVMFSGQDVELNAAPVDQMPMHYQCSGHTFLRAN
jgi:hypothetical protein